MAVIFALTGCVSTQWVDMLALNKKDPAAAYNTYKDTDLGNAHGSWIFVGSSAFEKENFQIAAAAYDLAFSRKIADDFFFGSYLPTSPFLISFHYVQAGDAYQKLGQLEKALAYYRLAQKNTPYEIVPLMRLCGNNSMLDNQELDRCQARLRAVRPILESAGLPRGSWALLNEPKPPENMSPLSQESAAYLEKGKRFYRDIMDRYFLAANIAKEKNHADIARAYQSTAQRYAQSVANFQNGISVINENQSQSNFDPLTEAISQIADDAINRKLEKQNSMESIYSNSSEINSPSYRDDSPFHNSHKIDGAPADQYGISCLRLSPLSTRKETGQITLFLNLHNACDQPIQFKYYDDRSNNSRGLNSIGANKTKELTCVYQYTIKELAGSRGCTKIWVSDVELCKWCSGYRP